MVMACSVSQRWPRRRWRSSTPSLIVMSLSDARTACSRWTATTTRPPHLMPTTSRGGSRRHSPTSGHCGGSRLYRKKAQCVNRRRRWYCSISRGTRTWRACTNFCPTPRGSQNPIRRARPVLREAEGGTERRFDRDLQPCEWHFCHRDRADCQVGGPREGRDQGQASEEPHSTWAESAGVARAA